MSFCSRRSNDGFDIWNEIAGEWDDIAINYTKCFYQYLITERNIVSSSILLNTGRPDNDMDEDEDDNNDIIRIIDFGCGTGLLIERLVEYFTTVTTKQKQQVHLIGIDSSKAMILILKEKIRNYDWNNTDNVTVTAVHANLCRDYDNQISNDTTTSLQMLHDWEGKVNLIIANSVLSYISSSSGDRSKTIEILTKLLKGRPSTLHTNENEDTSERGGGILIHSDWTTCNVISMTKDMIVDYDNRTRNDNESSTGLFNLQEVHEMYSSSSSHNNNNNNNPQRLILDSIQIVQWPNVQHHYCFSHTIDDDYNNNNNNGSVTNKNNNNSNNSTTTNNILIGIGKKSKYIVNE